MAQRPQTTFSHSQVLLLWSQIDSGMKIIRQAQALLAQRGTHLPTNSQAAHGGLLLGTVWLSFIWMSENGVFVESFSLWLKNRMFFVTQGVWFLISRFSARDSRRMRWENGVLVTSSYKYIFIDSIPQLLYYQPQALLHYLRNHRRNSVPYIFNFLILPNTEKILITLPVFPMEHLKNWNACHACHAKNTGARPSTSVSASDRRCSNLNGFAVDPGSLRVHAWSHVTKR